MIDIRDKGGISVNGSWKKKNQTNSSDRNTNISKIKRTSVKSASAMKQHNAKNNKHTLIDKCEL